MGWRIVQQPNRLLARFSDVVDDFTEYDMSTSEARSLCLAMCGERLASEKVRAALQWPERFDDCIATIAEVHGEAVAEERRKMLTTDPEPPCE